jgi:hypothetical protein
MHDVRHLHRFAVSSSGNYTVTANLTATGNCIVITVPNVAIDLQGHMIAGNGTGNGITSNSAAVVN